MARKIMAKYECSRCAREWYQAVTEAGEPADAPALQLKFTGHGEDVVVDMPELCSVCAESVASHVQAMTKKLRGMSPHRAKKKETQAKPASPPADKKPATSETASSSAAPARTSSARGPRPANRAKSPR